jgi:DNA-binding XRE family transcriptional regulator
MIINIDDIKNLLNQNIPDLTLARETGITRQTIHNLRKGNSSLEKMWIETAIKLQSYVDSNVHYSFDSDSLLEEAKADYEEFGDEPVLAVYENHQGHEFIVDYVMSVNGAYEADHLREGEKLKPMKMGRLVMLLKKQTEI